MGPPGACTSAAWSVDGQWMYFAVSVEGRHHLWRQRFPDGPPEQLTSGPTQEDGIAIAPDGRSLITSISTEQSALWLHDSKGDRALSTQGFVLSIQQGSPPPVFTTTGRIYYISAASPESPNELWRTDIRSGRSERLLPGISIRSFNVSDDEKEAVYCVQPPGRIPQIWRASLDRLSPPRHLAAGALPHFGPDGTIVFRLTEGKRNYLARMDLNGRNQTKYDTHTLINFEGVSPDRRFAIIFTEPSGAVAGDVQTLATPLNGHGAPHVVCWDCLARWSPDGRYFYVEAGKPAKTLRIPIPAGKMLPDLPENGIRETGEDWRRIRGVTVMEMTGVLPSTDPSTYAYVKSTANANLFRLQLQ